VSAQPAGPEDNAVSVLGVAVNVCLYTTGPSGQPGHFDLWLWERRAEEIAMGVDARRSFAAHLLFGRPLNQNATRVSQLHSDWQRRLAARGAEVAERAADLQDAHRTVQVGLARLLAELGDITDCKHDDFLRLAGEMMSRGVTLKRIQGSAL